MTRNELAQKFKEARERKGLSLIEAARILSIRVQIIEDLEEERYNRLGALLYIKSYIRKYAALLKLDMAEIEELLEKLEDPFKEHNTESLIRAQMNEEKRMVHRSFFRWYMALVLIIIVGVIVAYFVFDEKGAMNKLIGTQSQIFDQDNKNFDLEKINNMESQPINELSSLQNKVFLSDVISDETETIISSSIVTGIDLVDTESALSDYIVDQIIQGAGEVKDNEDMVVSSGNLDYKPLVEGNSVLVLSLNTQDCWIQIKDKDQKVIMNEVLPAGATYHIEGKAPFSLHLGNASSIEKMIIDDVEVERKLYRPTEKTTVQRVTIDKPTEGSN